MNKEELYDKSIEKCGWKAQAVMAIEEMAELTKEICNFYRDKGNRKFLAEELADVEIAVEQLIHMFKISDEVAAWKEFKLNRLQQKLKE